MITSDQFTNLPDDLIFVFSSRNDGTMLDRARGVHNQEIVSSRRAFCEQVGINYDQDVVYQRIVYDEHATYSLLAEVDNRSTVAHTAEIVADGLFTKSPGIGLFLPVADCIVTVLYDPIQRNLAQLHLGRHSTLTNLLEKTIQHFKYSGSNVKDIQVWMAPSATRTSYRLNYFEKENDPAWIPFYDKKSDGYYIDMQGFNKQVCITNGIQDKNVYISSIDTATNPNYFSHSQGDTTGRFAGLVMMRK